MLPRSIRSEAARCRCRARHPKRAERKLGECMDEERRAGKLAVGVRGKPGPSRGKRGSAGDPRFKDKDKPTLAERGIDKHLADHARKAAAMPETAFEA